MPLAAETRSVLAALSDATRVSIFDTLARSPASIAALSRDLPITRQATTKHLAVLETVGLVRSHRVGRQTVYEAVTAPLEPTVVDLSESVSSWTSQLALLKRAAEAQR